MTARLAVFGNPVAHSRSPDIHALFARQAGIDLTYEKILVPAGEFVQTADRFLEDGTGFNVTLPCKHDAFTYSRVLGDEARVAEAVNTISMTPDGEIRGDNTDGPGLVRDLTLNLGWQIAGKRVLVLGAGGAVAGVLASLVGEQPRLLHLNNRTMDRATRLAGRFDGVASVNTGELRDDYDLIINGTSAGLTGDTGQWPEGIVQAGAHCYDMVYGAAETAFMGWCLRQQDCAVSDGFGMLVEQAALSFNIWFDRDVDTGEVIRELRATFRKDR